MLFGLLRAGLLDGPAFFMLHIERLKLVFTNKKDMAAEIDKIEYGGDMMLFVDSKPIAFATDAKLSIKTKTRDASSKDSGSWTDKRGVRHDWNASASALFSDLITTVGTSVNTFDELFDMQIAKTPITVIFAAATGAVHAQTADATKKTYTGSAIITGLDPNAPDGDNASYSITLEGTGPLSKA